MTAVAELLRSIVGQDGVISEPGEIAGYRGDLAVPEGGDILCVVRPRNADQVSNVVKFCAEARIAITVRGGGTGLSGGATPLPGRQSVILTFERMRRIREIDPVGNSMTIEAGCSLQEAREAAELAGRLLGIDHGGRSSHIGGNLSTNAGGNNVLRYGMAREQVLGLEVVLANGEILSELSPLPKNNSGYDLKQLFIGSEGTLGLITAACLKLRQKSVKRVTACVGLDSLEDVLGLFALAREVLADSISAFELMPRAGLDFHFAHIGGRHEPFDTITPWIVLAGG